MSHETVEATMKALRDFHLENNKHFNGTIRINTEDAQAILDESIAAQPPADHDEPPTHPRVSHGQESVMFGKRCIADDSVQSGTVQLES